MLAAAVTWLLATAGCGQTGPLMLPGSESAPARTPPVSEQQDENDDEDEDRQ